MQYVKVSVNVAREVAGVDVIEAERSEAISAGLRDEEAVEGKDSVNPTTATFARDAVLLKGVMVEPHVVVFVLFVAAMVEELRRSRGLRMAGFRRSSFVRRRKV